MSTAETTTEAEGLRRTVDVVPFHHAHPVTGQAGA